MGLGDFADDGRAIGGPSLNQLPNVVLVRFDGGGRAGEQGFKQGAVFGQRAAGQSGISLFQLAAQLPQFAVCHLAVRGFKGLLNLLASDFQKRVVCLAFAAVKT